MIAILVALALAQNTNQSPIIVQQNGVTQSTFRANTINCQAGVSCAQSGTVMTINALGGDGGIAPTNVSGAAPITATPDGGNGFTIGITVPSCTSSGSALQYSAGVFSCVAIDAGSIKAVTASSPIVATPDGGGGVDISFPLYQTTGPLTLNLSMTGVDDGGCVSSACRTTAYVVTQIPKHIDHALTLALDGGTFDPLVLSGRIFSSTGSLTINGPAQVASTLATGTATGTLTSVSTGAFAMSVYSDSTQSWTTDDLRARMITMTSGAASGQSVMIASNTGTTVSVPGQFTNTPSIGDSYRISEPGVSFAGASPLLVTGNYGTVGSTMTMNDVKFAATSFNRFINYGVQLTANRSIFTSSGNSNAITTGTNNTLNSSNIFIQTSALTCPSSTTGTCVNVSGASVSLGLTGSVLYTSGFSAMIVASGTRLALAKTAVTATGTGAATTSGVVQFVGPLFSTASTQTNSFLNITCGAGMSAPAMRIYGGGGGTLDSAFDVGPTSVTLNGLITSGCPTGVALGGRSQLALTAATFTNTTTDVSVTGGSKFVIKSAPTTTGETTQLSIDGDPWTFGDLNAAPSKQFTNQTTQSTAVIQ